MRRLIPAALFISVLTLAAGCKAPEHPAGPTEHSPELRELGRPWPVEVGRFAAPFRFLGHDASGILFAAGRPATRYRVDYRLRRLVNLGPPRPQREEPYTATTETEGGRHLLFLIRPDGTRLLLTESLLDAAWAQTEDRRALAFYEVGPKGAQLVYCEPLAGIRAVWRRLEVPPAAATLAWSEEGSYLAEEYDGVLTVFARADGTSRWSAAGTAASFAPGERYLLYRQGEELRLLDLSRWYARVLPVPGGGRILSSAWSPDGERIFYLYKSAAAAGEAARLLYLYEVESGAWQRHPVPDAIDPLTLPDFLRARPAEIGPLLALLPRLNEGTLCRLGEGFYLGGRGRELVLLDLSTKKIEPKPLYRFPGPVANLSLAGQRLAVVAEEGRGLELYLWNLPTPAALTGIFPDRRDLSLGPLALGMKTAELRAALGAPLEIQKRPDPFGRQGLLATYYYPEAAVTIVRGRVERIVYSGPGVSTPRGVAVGTLRAEVLARYGRPDYELRDYLAYRGRVDGLSVKVAFKFDGEGCIFRLNSTTDSSGNRPAIPIQIDHRFRSKPTTRRSGIG